MTEISQSLLQEHFGERLQQNVALARYSTARVGGPARWFAEACSADELAADAAADATGTERHDAVAGFGPPGSLHELDAAAIADDVAVFRHHGLAGPYPTGDLVAEHGSLRQAWSALAGRDAGPSPAT